MSYKFSKRSLSKLKYMSMKTTENGIKIIKDNEGCKLKAYKCPVGVWTIGYGHTNDVKSRDEITIAKATEFLQEDLSRFETSVKKLDLDINQNQFDALVSFCYNVGPGNLAKSTLIRKAKVDPNNPTIRDEFNKWVKGRIKGVLQTLPGLVKRRKQEADLYFKKP